MAEAVRAKKLERAETVDIPVRIFYTKKFQEFLFLIFLAFNYISKT